MESAIYPTKKQMDELKTIMTLTPKIKRVYEAVLLLLESKPGSLRGKVDINAAALKMIGNDKRFLEALHAFDKENADPEALAEVRRSFLTDSDFAPEAVERASKAAAVLCRWVHSVAA